MTTIRGGLAVKPWVQAFANEADRATPVHDYSTYRGHQPAADLALDCFADLVAHPERGDRLCEWAQANYKRLGIDYLIYRQRIWNPEISPNWRPMADRGGVTANHRDHVHISFTPTAPNQEDFDMYDDAARDELVKRLDAMKGGIDEIFKKVAFLEEQVDKLVKKDG